MSNMPRSEHPRPQFVRKDWMNLNGEWQFEIDNSLSGEEKEFFKEDKTLDGKIIVPFCPESKLSGVCNTDFIYGVVYKKKINIPKEYLDGTTILHFGAVDYRSTVYVNEQKIGVHVGGYVSFSYDISKYIREGENDITVFAIDKVRDHYQPTGKQCPSLKSHGCCYTRSTGIWQTVWLENMPKTHLIKTKYISDINNCVLTIIAETYGVGTLSATAYYEGKEVGSSKIESVGGECVLSLPISEKHLWEIGNGRLYDLKLSYGDDEVQSYFGLREVSISDKKVYLNGKSFFMRTILDQGYYPDGIYTAPTDEDLKNDIILAMNCGFEGARLHEKIFEERFLYHADKLGYIVWGEYPDWGLDVKDPKIVYSIIPEWLEEINRDFNHPSIIGWCPRNEAWDRTYLPSIELIYNVTKAADPTRFCIDSSGGSHVNTDIYDNHYYAQDLGHLEKAYDMLLTGGRFRETNDVEGECRYDYSKPFFVSEYGGIAWSKDESGWGYGEGPKTEQEYYDRFKTLTEYFLNNPAICGITYTQLTDIEQEQNGLYYYDRTPKFDCDKLKAIVKQKAAIED